MMYKTTVKKRFDVVYGTLYLIAHKFHQCGSNNQGCLGAGMEAGRGSKAQNFQKLLGEEQIRSEFLYNI